MGIDDPWYRIEQLEAELQASEDARLRAEEKYDRQRIKETELTHKLLTAEHERDKLQAALNAKVPPMISVNDALPDFLPERDYSANVIARLESGSLVIANRFYDDDAGGWVWAVACGDGYDLENAEPEADDDYKVIEWMPLPPASKTTAAQPGDEVNNG